MVGANDLLARSIKVHPTFLLGVGVFTLALGAVLAQTLFPLLLTGIGLSVLQGAVIWLGIAIATMLLGIYRSFEVIDDAG